MHGRQRPEELLRLVKQEVKPAIGCTEPVAVAYAAACARRCLKGPIESLEVKTSLKIFKNGKSIIIPGTGECGLDLAAALGVVLDYPREALYIFEKIDQTAVTAAKQLVNQGTVSLLPVHSSEDILVEIGLEGAGERVKVLLNNHHTHIQLIEVNGRVIFEDQQQEAEAGSYNLLKTLTLQDLRSAVEEVSLDSIEFLLQGAVMNKFAAEQGLKKNSGLNWGASLLKLHAGEKSCSESFLKARILTAAGADFRMGGGNYPVMTSGGSGNQGLGIILPIVVVAEQIKASKEKLARALFLGHLINLYVKAYIGKLTAICGCAIAAGTGASAGIAWLLGGDNLQIAGAVKNVLANLTGMICDGAKESCALKLSTSAGEAVVAAQLACQGVIVPDHTGIIDKTVEGTIKNIETLCKRGLAKADEVLFEITST